MNKLLQMPGILKTEKIAIAFESELFGAGYSLAHRMLQQESETENPNSKFRDPERRVKNVVDALAAGTV